MPASGERHSNTLMSLLSKFFYGAYIVCIKLSGLPVVGGLIGKAIGGSHLKVITVPMGLKLQSESAILPFDAARTLVESASYVAGLDVCICRDSHGCKDYPIDLGCMFLGEGAGPSGMLQVRASSRKTRRLAGWSAQKSLAWSITSSGQATR